jgi:polysaccharide deacetylase 2 family uncharacterized protein YibQ
MVMRRRDGSRNIYLVLIGFALASILIIVAVEYLARFPQRGVVPPFEEPHRHLEEAVTPRIPIPPHQEASPKVAIIIDDLGYDTSLAEGFVQLDLPLTLSILPFAPHTRAIAHRARGGGREVMLHLPMEPRSYPRINPGDGVLLVSMERAAILQVLERDLSVIPFVKGVNNHMGSRFTEEREKMMVVLAELKRRGLYFVDSKTSPMSVAFDLARQMEIRTACRDIFLDNDLSEDALKIQMDRLLTVARHKGHAIGIGHPHKETLWLLRTFQAGLGKDVEVVPVSCLVNR